MQDYGNSLASSTLHGLNLEFIQDYISKTGISIPRRKRLLGLLQSNEPDEAVMRILETELSIAFACLVHTEIDSMQNSGAIRKSNQEKLIKFSYSCFLALPISVIGNANANVVLNLAKQRAQNDYMPATRPMSIDKLLGDPLRGWELTEKRRLMLKRLNKILTEKGIYFNPSINQEEADEKLESRWYIAANLEACSELIS